MPLLESTIPGLLADRAREQPDDVAYTYIDYDVDPAGFAESLTWSQMYHRVQVVAQELVRHGSKGDRAAILAPQGLEYIIAFYGDDDEIATAAKVTPWSERTTAGFTAREFKGHHFYLNDHLSDLVPDLEQKVWARCGS